MRSFTITCDLCRESFPWKGKYESGWALLEIYGASGSSALATRLEICQGCRAKILELRAPHA